MRRAILKAGMYISWAALTALLTAIILVAGSDKIWPGAFEDRQTWESRRVLREELRRLSEANAENEINQILLYRRLAPPRPGELFTLRDDTPAAEYRMSPPELEKEGTASVRLEVEAVSGKTGLLWGRKVDYREACLPLMFLADYTNVRIFAIGPDGKPVKNTPSGDKQRLSANDYGLLTSRQPKPRRMFIRKLGAGCYGATLPYDDIIPKLCVVAVAVSGRPLGGGSVTTTKCRIEANY